MPISNQPSAIRHPTETITQATTLGRMLGKTISLHQSFCKK